MQYRETTYRAQEVGSLNAFCATTCKNLRVRTGLSLSPVLKPLYSGSTWRYLHHHSYSIGKLPSLLISPSPFLRLEMVAKAVVKSVLQRTPEMAKAMAYAP